jgi:hypothetical protein
MSDEEAVLSSESDNSLPDVPEQATESAAPVEAESSGSSEKSILKKSA